VANKAKDCESVLFFLFFLFSTIHVDLTQNNIDRLFFSPPIFHFFNTLDTQKAGIPSKLRNRFIDDSQAMCRGPAMTVNSQMMNPSRNPVTGYNMGEGFSLGPGERKVARKRIGKTSEAEYHSRRGEDASVTTHMRMFGDTYVDAEAQPVRGLKTSFSNDGTGAGGTHATHLSEEPVLDSHRVSNAKSLINPHSKGKPMDYDRREAHAKYQTELWEMHEELPSYGQDKMIRGKYGY